ncbi:MAG: hypothetical protein ACI9IP_001965 [Arcticibacterium sp.]|jgi:hypothetical protein
MAKSNPDTTERILATKILAEKKSLMRSFNQNFDTQEKTLSLLVKSLEYSQSKEYKSLINIFNLAGYINLVSYDLKIVSRDLTFATQRLGKEIIC